MEGKTNGKINTVSTDKTKQAMIAQALAQLRESSTILVIAHKLDTIRSADRIVVIDGGRIVEEGRHDELLARGDLYADLHKTQLDRSRERAVSETAELA